LQAIDDRLNDRIEIHSALVREEPRHRGEYGDGRDSRSLFVRPLP